MPYGPETGSACLSLEFGSASSQVGAEKKRCTDASTAGPTSLGKQRMNVPNFVLPGSSAPVGRSLVKIELIVGLEGGNFGTGPRKGGCVRFLDHTRSGRKF